MCFYWSLSRSAVGLSESFLLQHAVCFLSAAVLAVYSQTVCWHPVERTVCSSRQLTRIFWLFSHFSLCLHPIGYKTSFSLSILVLGNHHLLLSSTFSIVVHREKCLCRVLLCRVNYPCVSSCQSSRASAGLCFRCVSVFLVSLLCVSSVWRFLSLFSVSPKNAIIIPSAEIA